MAQRRMISLDIVDTDAFLDMSLSAQSLYFHLNTRADDDGFISNPKKIMRMLGVQQDDMKTLIGKKFILFFVDGDSVCAIKHWRINNFIRKDIYKETKYVNLKKQLLIRPNGAYTFTENGDSLKLPEGHFSLDIIKDSSVNAESTSREPRLGKVRLGKVSKTTEATASEKFDKLGAEIIKALEVVDPKNKKYYGNTSQRKACDFLLEEYGLEEVLKRISVLSKTNKLPYFPTITTPVQLRDKWVPLQDAVERKRGELSAKSKVAFS